MNSVAVINWINTFEIGTDCKSIDDLTNGIFLARACNEIAPDYFDLDLLNSSEAMGNWVIASSNLKKLLRMLDEYFRTALNKQVDDISSIDPDSISRNGNLDHLSSLVELVVGAAVMCENKGVFISRIFALDEDSQRSLKDMIEVVMARVTPLSAQESADEYDSHTRVNENPHDTSEDLLRSQELIKHLQEERQRLLGEVSSQERSRQALQTELDQARISLQLLQAQTKATGADSTDLAASRASATAAATVAQSALQAELAELRRELDLQLVETTSLKSALKAAQQRHDASREMQAKLEMENHQMADELDVTRDKAQRLAKVEATLDKYQKRLEEMAALKKQNKELQDQMDAYLDQIQELEGANKGLVSLQKLVEQYRDKAVELERERFEAVTAQELTAHEVQRLRGELETAGEAKRFLEDEVDQLRAEAQQRTDSATDSDRGFSLSSATGGDPFEVESVTSLREKLRRAERELASLKAAGTAGAADTGVEGLSETKDVPLLQAELADLRQAKKEREDALIAVKKHNAELQSELTKAHRAMQEAEREREREAGGVHNQAANAVRDLEQRATVTAGVVKHMEELLKEKEATIDRLEQEKGKLETYARRTLSSFKEKYMSTLQAMKAEKRALEERVTQLTTRNERNQETSRREERLLMSAMYEIGLRMMDRSIQQQVLEPSSQTTFLGSQRKAHTQAITTGHSNVAPSSHGVSTSLAAVTPSK